MSLLGGIVDDVLGDSQPATDLLQGVQDVLSITLLGDSQRTATAAAAAAPKQTSTTSTTSTASVSTPPPATSSAPAPQPTTVTSKSSPLPSSTKTVSTSTLSTSSVSPASRAESATGIRSLTKSNASGLIHTSSSASPAQSTFIATAAKTQSGSSSHPSISTGFIVFLACAGFILLWILVMGMVLRRRRHRINAERSREVQTQMSGMVGFGKLDDDNGAPIPLQRARKNTIDWIEESNGFEFVQPRGVIDPNMYHSNLAHDEKHSDLGNFSRAEMMGMQEYPPPPPPPKMYHEHEIGIGMQPQYVHQPGVPIGNTPPMYIPDTGLERAMESQANQSYTDPHHFQDQSTIRADQRDSSFPESMSHDDSWNQPEPSSWATHDSLFPQTPSAVHSSHLDVSTNQRFSTGLGYLYPGTIRDSISERSDSHESGVTRTSISESEATDHSDSYGRMIPSFTPVELSACSVDGLDRILSRSASDDTIGPTRMPLPGDSR